MNPVPPMLRAQSTPDPVTPAATPAAPPAAPPAPQPGDDSPAARMARRWPQPARVGFLVGLPMLDDDDRTLGFVTQVVKSPEGAIKLIVAYNRTVGWFRWFTRPVAVPIEVVAIFGRQIGSVDMEPPAYAAAPTWVAGRDVALPGDDHVLIALMRR